MLLVLCSFLLLRLAPAFNVIARGHQARKEYAGDPAQGGWRRARKVSRAGEMARKYPLQHSCATYYAIRSLAHHILVRTYTARLALLPINAWRMMHDAWRMTHYAWRMTHYATRNTHHGHHTITQYLQSSLPLSFPSSYLLPYSLSSVLYPLSPFKLGLLQIS